MTSVYGVDSNCSWYLSGGFSGCIFRVEEVGVGKSACFLGCWRENAFSHRYWNKIMYLFLYLMQHKCFLNMKNAAKYSLFGAKNC